MADDFDGIIKRTLGKKLSIKVRAPKGFYKVPSNGGDLTVHKNVNSTIKQLKGLL